MDRNLHSLKTTRAEWTTTVRNLLLLWTLTGILLLGSGLVGLNRADLLPLYQGRALLTDIQPERGFAYTASTGRPAWSSHEQPSLAQVLEDGKPLPGPANALHEDIRTLGQGRYSFWQDYVYFSASDNSDPRTNGRQYEIRGSLLLPAWLTWLVYGMTSLALGSALVWTLRKNWQALNRIPGVLAIILKRGITSFSNCIRFLRTNRVISYAYPMLFWLFLVLFGMEIFLRLTVYNRPFFFHQSNWFGSIPAEGTFYLWGKEGYAVTRYEGLAGEIATPYHDGTIDILLLGDSLTEALQVPDAQKYASVAEMWLRQAGYDADIHNLGHSGASMADYVSWLPGYRKMYAPRLIVIQLAPNDFSESFSEKKSNYFVADGNEIVDLVHRYDLSGECIVGDSVHMGVPALMWASLGRERLTQVKVQVRAPDWLLALDVFQPDQTRMERADIRSVTGDSDNLSDEFNVELAQQQVDLLLEGAGEVPVIIILFPHAPSISETGDQIVWNDPKQEILVNFFSQYYPQVTVVDPVLGFQALAEDGILPMGFFNSTTPGWGHLNRDGHQVLGESLAETLAEALK